MLNTASERVTTSAGDEHHCAPLARTSAEKIARLRETWAGRARPATRPEAGQQSAFRGGVRQIDL